MISARPAARPTSGKPPRPPGPPVCICDIPCQHQQRPIIRVNDGILFAEGVLKPTQPPAPPAPYFFPSRSSARRRRRLVRGASSVTTICVTERSMREQLRSRVLRERPILHDAAFAAVAEAINSEKPRLVLNWRGAAASPAHRLLRRLAAHEAALDQALAEARSQSEPLRYTDSESLPPPFGVALGEPACPQVDVTWVEARGASRNPVGGPPAKSRNCDHYAAVIVVPKGESECPAEEDGDMLALLQAVKRSLRKPEFRKFVVEAAAAATAVNDDDDETPDLDMIVKDCVSSFKKLLKEAKEVAESVRRRAAGDPKGKGVVEG